MSAFYVLRIIDDMPKCVHNHAFPHKLTRSEKGDIVRAGALEHDHAYLYRVSPEGDEHCEAVCDRECKPVSFWDEDE